MFIQDGGKYELEKWQKIKLLPISQATDDWIHHEFILNRSTKLKRMLENPNYAIPTATAKNGIFFLHAAHTCIEKQMIGKNARRKCWRAKDWWKHIFRIFTGKYLLIVYALRYRAYSICTQSGKTLQSYGFRAIFAISPLIVRFVWFYRVEDAINGKEKRFTLKMSVMKRPKPHYIDTPNQWHRNTFPVKVSSEKLASFTAIKFFGQFRC